ncbi:hypothetical protein PMIN01_02936 [Paraphaeosphaeria minitans]|uniref:Uncharacterized protein n=1 Tax=Paraphaeosphaeria minitans TaxID=565426 RepID=A0A9P6GR52_9PLEO|nr:hypothetical protein PMIN01_02936 [Paraphaeosphaeria minitans]
MIDYSARVQRALPSPVQPSPAQPSQPGLSNLPSPLFTSPHLTSPRKDRGVLVLPSHVHGTIMRRSTKAYVAVAHPISGRTRRRTGRVEIRHGSVGYTVCATGILHSARHATQRNATTQRDGMNAAAVGHGVPAAGVAV